MAWDVSKRPSKLMLWEAIVFALLPILLVTIGLGQYFGAPRLVLGFLFLFLPVDFGLCMLALDDVRNR